MRTKRKMTIVSCAALVLCMAFSGCGSRDGEGDASIPGIEPVPIGSEAGTDGAGDDAADAANDVESSAPTEAGDAGLQGGSSQAGDSGSGEAPASAPAVSCEILREARTDDAGAEVAFAEYPMFTVTGDGYAGLSAALASINEECRSQSGALLDELEGSVKDYRESVDPAGVFGQEVTANVTRCDAEVVSILVVRTVTMGGPHPNNDQDCYNLNAGTGETLQLSQFLTMDDAMVETVIERLHDNYPEVEFDDAVLREEIPEIVAGGGIGWYFFEGQIDLTFPEGSFGFGHAVGSLGVTVSLD